MLALIEYLTAITPDDTWINQLHYRDGTLILNGQSNAALKYQNELIDSNLFLSAEFDSDIRRRPNSDKESFAIRAQVDPSALSPEAVAAFRSAAADQGEAGEGNL
jgi:hypothetical protein